MPDPTRAAPAGRPHPTAGAAALLLALLLAAPVASAQETGQETGFETGHETGGAAGQGGYLRLEGHGGPVKGVAVSPDGRLALTASFDTALGLWALPGGRHIAWLDGHEAAANAALFLGQGRAVSAGDDFALVLWDLDTATPLRRLTGHRGKVIDAALSPDGQVIASASWDGTVGLWPVAGGEARFLEGHRANVNDVAFAAQGEVLYSASYDGTIRRWDLTDDTRHGGDSVVVSHGFGVNHLVVHEPAGASGWIAYGALDGTVRVRDLATGAALADLTADRKPILALAHDPAAGLMAVGDGEGHIMVVETAGWVIRRDFRAALAGPIWALAWEPGTPDTPGRLLAGGLADEAALWPVADAMAEGSGDALFAGARPFHADPATMTNGERQFVRKCSICHTLTPDGGRKAGPTLWGVFGRPAGTLPGYRFSDALVDSDIVWSEETIAALFREGPDIVTPGSKMPVQRITGEDDRRDLIAYLKAETGVATAPGAKTTDDEKTEDGQTRP